MESSRSQNLHRAGQARERVTIRVTLTRHECAHPWQQPPEQVVEQMIASLAASGRVRCVMTYGARDGGAQVPKFAQRHGLKVIQGIWLTDDEEANTKETLAGEWLAKNFKDTVVAVSCGSEVMLRHHRGIADTVVTRCVKYLRGAGVTQPITHQAGWAEWCGESDVRADATVDGAHPLAPRARTCACCRPRDAGARVSQMRALERGCRNC